MKKIYLILAAAVGMTITSCTTNDYLGEVDPNAQTVNDGAIRFGTSTKGMTRADIGGDAAATLLGNNFYVMGTKGTEPANSPTTTVVFDNYLVHYGINTAGTTESNTANWEYVGIDQGAATPTVANHVKLSSTTGPQTIKFWDYSVDQYDFFAFSTGTFKAVAATTSPGDDEIGVIAMRSGSVLASSGVAYEFNLPSVAALTNTYFTDITEVFPGSYGKEVNLQFKSLATKVRVALYETVPGYSVKDVEFYENESDPITKDLTTSTDAILISTDGIPTKGKISVYYPYVGNTNASKEAYDKAAVTVVAGTDPETAQSFDALTDQLVVKERAEAGAGSSKLFLGRSLTEATFAGSEDAKYYKPVFPVSSPAPLILRVNYTLVPIDGAAETIKVKGAKAVVPSTYTKWLPNYAYTYIFKISDNTNGWTGTTSQPAGLFPITFDAVVAEATDANAEQTTITTVATPTITTYQQGHAKTSTNNEYSKTQTAGKSSAAKNIYVQVMDNNLTPAVLAGTGSSELYLLNATTSDAIPTNRSLLYKVTGSTPITEATVMDALENQASVSSGTIVGRNGLTLAPGATINTGVTSIVNGVDDNPIEGLTAGTAAEIVVTSLDVATYAYVYDYSSAAKENTTIYQPITASGTLANGTKYVTTTVLNGIDTTDPDNVTAENEAVNSNSFVYFSKTTNGSDETTYSFISVDGKKNLPAGLVKCPVGSLLTSDGGVAASSALYVFNVYTRNTGKYAVKVIKIIA